MHACIWRQVTKTDLPYPCTTHTDKVFSLELQHACSTHLSLALPVGMFILYVASKFSTLILSCKLYMVDQWN